MSHPPFQLYLIFLVIFHVLSVITDKIQICA